MDRVMDILRFDQILVLTVFMAVLGAVWLLVQRNKHKLSGKLHNGRRLHLRESVALNAHQRATILSVDGRDYLVLHGKTGTPALQALAHSAPMDGAEVGGQA
jgi:flagellar protein FliO/FliZ